MPHNSDDQITLTLPRYGVTALATYAKHQAKALQALASSPVKWMKRKAEARREEAAAWQAVERACKEAMANYIDPRASDPIFDDDYPADEMVP